LKILKLKLGTKIILSFGLLSLVIFILVLVTIIKINTASKISNEIHELRIPTALTSKKMRNGINHSLASLRAWIILGKKEFRDERDRVWDEEVAPALKEMIALSPKWSNPQNIQRLEKLKKLLKHLKHYQEKIENIAHTKENQPALNILFVEAVPQASFLVSSITKIINLELDEPATKKRKSLLGVMADIRGATSVSLSHIRAYLLSGDEKFKASFDSSWQKNIIRIVELKQNIHLLTAKQKEEFEYFWTVREHFEKLPRKMFEIRSSDEWNIAYSLLEKEAVPRAKELQEILTMMIGNQRRLMQDGIIDSNEIIDSLKVFSWFILVFGLLASMLVFFWTKKTITGEILAFQSGLIDFFKFLNKEISEVPKLDDTVDDEIGRMAKIINVNISKISNILKLHEEVFKQLEENKKAIDEHAIVAVTDTKGIITYVNDKLVSISGYSREELIGTTHKLLDSSVHDRIFWTNMYETIWRKESWHEEVCNRRKDGTFYWVDTTIVPILDNNDNIKNFIAIRSDITERKSNELELIEAKEKAILSDQAKSEFLANMSHEIRTPLNAIIGFIDILKENESEEEKIKYLETISHSSKSLTAIINDILDFSKIESGKLAIDFIDFNPKYELDSSQELFKAKCAEKNITLVIEYKHLPASLNGDILRIKQIMNNILSNAIKFTGENKNIFLNVEYMHKQLKVSVRDEGIGISTGYQENIFDSFSQADNSTTRQYGGTGLGLSISYNLVKLMGGELKLKSTINIGS
jgi:PAS domain S-box-containing protein